MKHGHDVTVAPGGWPGHSISCYSGLALTRGHTVRPSVLLGSHVPVPPWGLYCCPCPGSPLAGRAFPAGREQLTGGQSMHQQRLRKVQHWTEKLQGAAGGAPAAPRQALTYAKSRIDRVGLPAEPTLTPTASQGKSTGVAKVTDPERTVPCLVPASLFWSHSAYSGASVGCSEGRGD